MPHLRILPLLVFLLFLSACTSVRPVSPEINLLDIRVGDLTLSHANLLAQLRVYNPNSVPITVRGVTYDFLLNGIRIASGQTVDEISIAPQESGETTLRLSTGYLNLLQFTRNRHPGEAIRYIMDGRIKVGGPRVIDTAFPFLKEGEFPLDQLPLK